MIFILLNSFLFILIKIRSRRVIVFVFLDNLLDLIDSLWKGIHERTNKYIEEFLTILISIDCEVNKDDEHDNLDNNSE